MKTQETCGSTDALVRAMVAEKIADRALKIALQALTKVRAMEKRTHKVVMYDSAKLGESGKLDMPEIDGVNEPSNDVSMFIDEIRKLNGE